jgi:hypothetical protein
VWRASVCRDGEFEFVLRLKCPAEAITELRSHCDPIAFSCWPGWLGEDEKCGRVFRVETDGEFVLRHGFPTSVRPALDHEAAVEARWCERYRGLDGECACNAFALHWFLGGSVEFGSCRIKENVRWFRPELNVGLPVCSAEVARQECWCLTWSWFCDADDGAHLVAEERVEVRARAAEQVFFDEDEWGIVKESRAWEVVGSPEH